MVKVSPPNGSNFTVFTLKRNGWHMDIPVEINRGYLEQPFYTVEWEMPVVWLFFDQKTCFFTVEWLYQSCCKMVSSNLKP